MGNHETAMCISHMAIIPYLASPCS